RQPRLGVIDSAMVDTRRRLLLIRRDNVEHLIMTGGPTDIVIEPNIVRATTAAPAREAAPARATPSHADAPPRAVPLADGGHWPPPADPPPAAAPPPRAAAPPRPPAAPAARRAAPARAARAAHAEIAR